MKSDCLSENFQSTALPLIASILLRAPATLNFRVCKYSAVDRVELSQVNISCSVASRKPKTFKQLKISELWPSNQFLWQHRVISVWLRFSLKIFQIKSDSLLLDMHGVRRWQDFWRLLQNWWKACAYQDILPFFQRLNFVKALMLFDRTKKVWQKHRLLFEQPKTIIIWASNNWCVRRLEFNRKHPRKGTMIIHV